MFSSCGNNIKESKTTPKPNEALQNIYKQSVVDSELLSTWERFKKIVALKDYSAFKKISLDSLEVCDTVFNISKFQSKCFLEVFDTKLLKIMSDTTYTAYVDHGIMLEYFPQYALKEIDVQETSITLNQFQILKELTPDGGWTFTFDFIKTKKGYKFYGCGSFGGPICCR